MRSQSRDRSFSGFSCRKLLEPEAVRLQNDIESLTRALGLQRRKTASLDERVQHFSREILSKKEKLGRLVPSSKEEQSLQNKLMVLDNQLCKEQVNLNKALVENEHLRSQINTYRREKSILLSGFKAMEEESGKLADKAEEASRVSRQLEEDDLKFRKELVSLKHRSEEKLESFQSRSAFLQVEIEQDRHIHRDVSASVTEQFYPDSLVFFDNNSVLKELYTKWVSLCKEQKKAVDQYNRTVRYLSDAFSEIKEATGVGSISEIVTGLIKALEQEKALLANLNKVTAQADDLDARLANLHENHRRMIEAQQKSVAGNEEHLNELNKELAGLRSLLRRKSEKQAKLMREVESIQQPVSELLTAFQETQLQGSAVNFAESARGADIMQKVALLEKAILFMVQYISLSEKSPLPAVFGGDLEEKVFREPSRSALSAIPIDDPAASTDTDRPLTAQEIRQRTRQKFQQFAP